MNKSYTTGTISEDLNWYRKRFKSECSEASYMLQGYLNLIQCSQKNFMHSEACNKKATVKAGNDVHTTTSGTQMILF